MAGPPVGPGRVYSVWDWTRCEYDYFYDPQGPSDAGGWVARPVPEPLAPVSPHGDPVESFLTELPAGARWIGRGVQAWGEVAARDRAAALDGRATGLDTSRSGYQSIVAGLGHTEDDGSKSVVGWMMAIGAVGLMAAVVWDDIKGAKR